jgi:hypothetical protein
MYQFLGRSGLFWTGKQSFKLMCSTQGESDQITKKERECVCVLRCQQQYNVTPDHIAMTAVDPSERIDICEKLAQL